MGKERFLVVGATGQVGRQLVRELGLQHGSQRVLQTSRYPSVVAEDGAPSIKCDLAHLRAPRDVYKLLKDHDICAVYCVGGMTHVDGCEAQPEVAYAVNAQGPQALSKYAALLRIPFIYYSTEYVFPGTSEQPGPYTELSSVRPVNAYGRSKLDGERRVLDSCPSCLVIRTTVVYGPDTQQKNFVYAMLRNLGSGIRMKVPVDQVSTPTYNKDLVNATLGLVRTSSFGIYHACGPEILGRFAFAKLVAHHLGLDPTLLEGVGTQELQQSAPRPLAAGLYSSKLMSRLPQLRMRTVDEAIQDWATDLQEPS